MNVDLTYVSSSMKDILAPGICNNHHINRELSFIKVKKGYVLPFLHWEKSIGGIANSNGEAIKDFNDPNMKESFSPFKDVSPSCRKEKAIYLGYLIDCFGHSFTDNLRKLWFLKTKECEDAVNEGYIFVYTTLFNQELPNYAREIIKYSGFDLSSAEHIINVTQFEEIILPDNSLFPEEYGRCYTNEYLDTVAQLFKKVIKCSTLSQPIAKIYLSRKKITKNSKIKRDINEREIEREMNKLGYISLCPEDYCLADQIYYVSHCSHLATTEGSIAHISLFCRPGTNVTIICKSRYLNSFQVAINQIADLNVTYVEANHSKKKALWIGPFYLCINKYFISYIGHYVPHMPYFLRCSYWKYPRIIPRIINKLFRILNIKKRI